MKRILKITGITLASLLGLVIVLLAVACLFVFTPARLTPIVQRVADKVLTCPAQIGQVNLTLVKTFPDLGLVLDDVVIVNPVPGAPSDTVASLKELDVAVDVKAFLNDRSIRVKRLAMNGVTAHLYTSPDSLSNFDILPASDKEKEDSTSFDLSSLDADLRSVTLHNLTATYHDCPSGMHAVAEGLDLSLKGSLQKGDLNADLETSLQRVLLSLGGDSALHVGTSGVALKVKADSRNDDKKLKGRVSLTSGPVDFGVSTVSISTQDLDLTVNGGKWDEKWQAEGVVLTALQPTFDLSGSTPIAISGDQLDLALVGASLFGNTVSGMSTLAIPDFCLSLGGEQWVDHRPVGLAVRAQTNTSFNDFAFDEGMLNIDDIKLQIHEGRLDLTDSTATAIAAHLITGHWDVPRVLALLPHSIRKALPDMTIRRAGLDLDLTAAIRAGSQGLAIDAADGSVRLDRVDMSLGDSMAFVTPQLNLTVKRPTGGTRNAAFREFLQGTLQSPAVDADLTGLGTATLTTLGGTFALSDFTDSRTPFGARAHLTMEGMHADLDTIHGTLTSPVIDATLSTVDGKPHYQASLTTDALSGQLGGTLTASTAALAIDAKATYDKSKKEILEQWSPVLDINLHTGHAELGMFPEPIDIPHIQFAFTPGKFHIDESAFRLGHSDFCLKGDITNLDAWMAKTGLLTGDLEFTSDYADATELMELISGLGGAETEDESKGGSNSDPSDPSAPASPDEALPEDDPFMVPLGVDVTLRTDIRRVGWNGFDFHNLGGRITCRDGVLVMEELGFTSEAATMQLTAMYKSPRKNHLFMGLDFHLIDIDIPDLIALVPAVDTIVPMLKSFDGQAQFHLAGESYLKSNYDLKLSTLRGAAAIEAKDLVVLPSSTFATIKKYLMTDKSTENSIDSLDVELSVFRDEVDVYPFRVRLGEYEAIVGGRHNINKDLDFDYHLSVTDTPLPVRLGLDVKGTLDDMHFNLATPKYTNLYKPEKRGTIQERSLELKKVINESLKRNVHTKEYYDKQ